MDPAPTIDLPEVPKELEFLVPILAQHVQLCVGGWSHGHQKAARCIINCLMECGLEVLDRSEIEALINKLALAQEVRGESDVSNDVDDALRATKEYLEGLLPANS